MKAAILAAGMPAARAFLSNTFLAVFVFSIANAKTIVAGMSGRLQVPVFAFLLIEIATSWQQFQVC